MHIVCLRAGSRRLWGAELREKGYCPRGMHKSGRVRAGGEFGRGVMGDWWFCRFGILGGTCLGLWLPVEGAARLRQDGIGVRLKLAA